jgi:hypothetical protein
MSTPAVGSSMMKKPRAGRKPAADENLLLIAAAQPIDERRPVARTDIEPIQHIARFLSLPHSVDWREGPPATLLAFGNRF